MDNLIEGHSVFCRMETKRSPIFNLSEFSAHSIFPATKGESLVDLSVKIHSYFPISDNSRAAHGVTFGMS
jgi:hypothetical protein